MSYWDTSALVKLSVAEADSAWFRELAAGGSHVTTASIARLEARTAFRRREAEGALPLGEATLLSAEMDNDVRTGRVVIQTTDAEVERAFANVLDVCFSATPLVHIRTNDALHIASAIVAGEVEFVTADHRQCHAARLMGLTVRP